MRTADVIRGLGFISMGVLLIAIGFCCQVQVLDYVGGFSLGWGIGELLP